MAGNRVIGHLAYEQGLRKQLLACGWEVESGLIMAKAVLQALSLLGKPSNLEEILACLRDLPECWLDCDAVVMDLVQVGLLRQTCANAYSLPHWLGKSIKANGGGHE